MATAHRIFSMIMKKFSIFHHTNTLITQVQELQMKKGNKDNVLNVPLDAGTQSHEFLNAYESIFKKTQRI